MTEDYRTRNDASLARLGELVQNCTDSDLDRPLGEGWTVKASLMHLAFWDRYAAAALQQWQLSGYARSGEDDAFINVAALNDWLAAAPEYARSEPIAAAEATNQAADALDDPLIAAIEAGGETWVFNRYIHRNEHIEQIEQELAASP